MSTVSYLGMADGLTYRFLDIEHVEQTQKLLNSENQKKLKFHGKNFFLE